MSYIAHTQGNRVQLFEREWGPETSGKRSYKDYAVICIKRQRTKLDKNGNITVVEQWYEQTHKYSAPLESRRAVS